MNSLRIAIVRDLVRTLRGITRAAGYQTDLGLVTHEFHATSRERFGAGQTGAVVNLRGGQRAEASSRTQARLDIEVSAWARYTPTREGSASGLEAIEPAITDIERAVVEDVTRGGVAVDTRIVSFAVTEDGESDAVVWGTVRLEVLYYHDHDDPRVFGDEVGGPDA